MTSLNKTSLLTNKDWLSDTLNCIKRDGYMIVEDLISPDKCAELSSAMYAAKESIHNDVGIDRLERAGEKGVLRLLMKYNRLFADILSLQPILNIVDNTVSDTAVMHLQNGFILPPVTSAEAKNIFQFKYHMDFPRVLNGYLSSINTLITIDEFTKENGGTNVVPCSHQSSTLLSNEELAKQAVPVSCKAGSMIVFDSTLWHAAGINTSTKDRLGINLQFTRSYFKQQFDYVRALGAEYIQALPERTQQLLGWYTRVVTSLDEYYQPTEKRLYRAAQG